MGPITLISFQRRVYAARCRIFHFYSRDSTIVKQLRSDIALAHDRHSPVKSRAKVSPHHMAIANFSCNLRLSRARKNVGRFETSRAFFATVKASLKGSAALATRFLSLFYRNLYLTLKKNRRVLQLGP